MGLNGLLVVLLSSSLVHAYNFGDSDSDWDLIESFIPSVGDGDNIIMPRVKAASSISTSVNPLRLPGSVRIPASKLHKTLFSPEKGSRRFPPEFRSLLLPDPVTPTAPAFSEPKIMDVMCFLDWIHVRVLKSLFTDPDAEKNLRLGNCLVNKVSDTHFHFFYSLRRCATRREETPDSVHFWNTLRYKPVELGIIVRELPISLTVRCTYARYHRAYKVGFLPQLVPKSAFKALQTRLTGTLTVMDGNWRLPPAGQSFVMAKPVCFEAKNTSGEATPGKRLYLDSCFVTATQNPTTNRYTVMDNYGCLMDSKKTLVTKFFTSPNKMTARFCLSAFLFRDMISLPHPKKSFYMHCEFGLGPEIPTPTAKSCTYNPETKSWSELSGDPSVCNCCDSTCPVSPKASNKMITSESWDLKMGGETSFLPTEGPMPEFPVDSHGMEWFWETDNMEDDFYRWPMS